MSALTPLPWRVGRPGTVVADHPVDGMVGSDDIAYYGGHLIAESIISPNAEFIVRACNAHDDLVKACEIGLTYIEAVCFNTPNDKKRRNYNECARIIRAALAKAGAA